MFSTNGIVHISFFETKLMYRASPLITIVLSYAVFEDFSKISRLHT